MPKNFNSLSYHISEEIRQYIYTEELKEDDKLPTERFFVSLFEVTRITIRKALQRLIDENLIYSIPNSGYYISAKKILRNSSDYFFPDNDPYLYNTNYKKINIENKDCLKNMKDPSSTNYLEKINNRTLAITSISRNRKYITDYPNLFENNKPNNLFQKQTITVLTDKKEYKEIIKILNINKNDTLLYIHETISDHKKSLAVCESICIGSQCELIFNFKPSDRNI